jgi:hypothetical protein
MGGRPHYVPRTVRQAVREPCLWRNGGPCDPFLSPHRDARAPTRTERLPQSRRRRQWPIPLGRIKPIRARSSLACVAVYKVDRLTRSLADFAKLVELFDKHSVSFVSVTQQFNATTSMGRLTLNVLLSFAQFEREVTSERIRDKIAANARVSGSATCRRSATTPNEPFEVDMQWLDGDMV